jgi:hypothetical protein
MLDVAHEKIFSFEFISTCICKVSVPPIFEIYKSCGCNKLLYVLKNKELLFIDIAGSLFLFHNSCIPGIPFDEIEKSRSPSLSKSQRVI